MSYCIRLNGRQEDEYVLAFRARIGISCARYLYSVIESTPSPWDSGSRIDKGRAIWRFHDEADDDDDSMLVHTGTNLIQIMRRVMKTSPCWSMLVKIMRQKTTTAMSPCW